MRADGAMPVDVVSTRILDLTEIFSANLNAIGAVWGNWGGQWNLRLNAVWVLGKGETMRTTTTALIPGCYNIDENDPALLRCH